MTIPRLDPAEGHFRIPSHRNGLSLFLRYLPPPKPMIGADEKRVILYVHGPTCPSSVSIAHRLAGRSWRDELTAAGFHVWGLDFLGYGGSDRFPEMAGLAPGGGALGGAEEASRQIESAVRFIRSWHQVDRVSIIAHSWGSLAAGCFATRHPELVDRLVWVAPIACRRTHPKAPDFPAWRLISLADQWEQFLADVPAWESPVLARGQFDEWGEQYLDSDGESRSRHPPAVKIPTGPFHDIQAAWAGEFPYDPGSVLAPVAILRGQWDSWCTDADARWLFDALSHSPVKRQVILGRGTHRLYLEEIRYALYREAQTFLAGETPVSKAILPAVKFSHP